MLRHCKSVTLPKVFRKAVLSRLIGTDWVLEAYVVIMSSKKSFIRLNRKHGFCTDFRVTFLSGTPILMEKGVKTGVSTGKQVSVQHCTNSCWKQVLVQANSSWKEVEQLNVNGGLLLFCFNV